jgi:hypothetical protein
MDIVPGKEERRRWDGKPVGKMQKMASVRGDGGLSRPQSD